MSAKLKPWRGWRNTYNREMQRRCAIGKIVRAMFRAHRAAIAKVTGGHA